MQTPHIKFNYMKQITFSLLVMVVYSACATKQQGVWKARPESYGMKVERNTKVQMSDGVQLLADVYTPTESIDKASGKTFPVLLTQNPYIFFLERPHINFVDFYVKRGYICVIAHVRGTNGSEGDLRMLSEREQMDGAEMVDWVSTRLRGSNGTVGLFGTSWLGFTQVLTAARLGKGSPVKAMVPTYMGAYFYREVVPGGVPSQSIYFFRDFEKMMASENATRFGRQVFEDWKNGGEAAYDNAFWREREPAYVAEKIVASGIPALFVGGWLDLYPSGISELYAFMQNINEGKGQWGPMAEGQKATDKYQLVMGPWAHYKGLNAEMTLTWYDKWLMGKSAPQFNTSTPYHAYNISDNKWYDFTTYPFTSDYSTFYFSDVQKVEKILPAGNAKASIAFGQRTQEGTTHTFRTETFTEPAVYAGPGAVRLFAGSSGSNMTFLLEIYDVDSKGNRQRITQGNVLGSLRAYDSARSWYTDGKMIRPFLLLQKDELVEPGEVYQLDFPLAPRLATISAGHHLEIVLSTMPDESDCAGNLGIFPCLPDERQLKQMTGGTFTIYLGKDHPSMMHLPLSAKTKLKSSSMNFDSTPNHPY